MEEARRKVQQVLATAKCPAVLSSFGKDSMLLLSLAREVCDFSVLWFRDGTDESFAKSIIRDWNLTVFSWAPADIYLLTNGERQAMISEYSFGEDKLPMLTDLAPGEKMTVQLSIHTAPLYPPFDVILWGAKDVDSHWVKGAGKFKEDGFQLGGAKVYAPLRHLTDDEVRAGLDRLGVQYRTESDELQLPRSQWPAEYPLDQFRQRFGLEV